MKMLCSAKQNKIATILAFSVVSTVVYADDTMQPAPDTTADTFLQMFTSGKFSGNFRTIDYTSRNAFFGPEDQNTFAYGGKLGFYSAALDGFSFGVSAFIQRGIDHSDNPAKVDGALGPNITTLGELYLQYKKDGVDVVVGNQQLNVPFAEAYDWRMVPQLFQGVSAKYGDNDNYVQAFKMFRFKAWTWNSFQEHTAYNTNYDPYSSAGMDTTGGFWGVGVAHRWAYDPITYSLQGWFQDYQDYAKLTYIEGQAIKSGDGYKPFIGVQGMDETGDGIVGHVRSQVWGVQAGVKHNSVTLSFNYDRIVPHSDSYLYGALVTPYSHDAASGPIFAQPFLQSTQDLGAGNAYAVMLNGSPYNGWFIGTAYSFMDLKPSPETPSLDMSEYLVFAIYNFSGKLKGLSVTDFLAFETSPSKHPNHFLQNRAGLEYDW